MNLFTSAFSARSKVVEIGQKRPLSLYLPVGSAVHSVAGKLWITQEGLIDDFVVSPGDRFDVLQKGQIVVSAIDETALVYLAPESDPGPVASPQVLDALVARAVQLRREEITRLIRLAVHYVGQTLRRLRKVWRQSVSAGLSTGRQRHVQRVR